MAHVLDRAQRHGLPRRRERALDFGCGVGRLTQALARRFDDVVGVDIAEGMVVRARELNTRDNCTFLVNVTPDLRPFDSATFDFVYTSLVLQHLPSRELAMSYVREFVRVARPDGLIVFQLPETLSLRDRIALPRRVYALVRPLGLAARLLRRKSATPMRMLAIPRHDVEASLAATGARVVEAESLGGGSVRYYAAAAEAAGARSPTS